MDAFIGKRLDGRYEIHTLIGKGGMANVYKAKDLKTDGFVAVKILREEFLDNEDLVRRFKNESRAISLLNHPNIVKVTDVSVTDKVYYIVMQFIDGITLKEYIEQRNNVLTWKEAIHFVSQILSALQHAHEKSIIHRDIKPQNIMLLRDGTIKIMDFGIARFSQAGIQLSTDKAMGSVHYISPEQAKGDVTDHRADIYSMGIMLYEMLTGKLPFDSDTAVNVALKQISDKPVSLKEINPDIPDALESITMKAIQKSPTSRYQSANEMLLDINEFKKNPSIKFEYKYVDENSPERFINSVMSTKQNKQPENSRPKKKTEKKKSNYLLPILAGMAVAFAIGATILVFMIFKFSGNPLFDDTPSVELPNFKGMTMSEIKANPAYADFRITFEENFRDDIEAGEIYDQSPKPPKEVKKNAKITLKVSKGVQEVTVPDVLGETKNDAEKILTALDLSVMVVRQPDSTVPKGCVFRTTPGAGTIMSTGQRITVYIAGDIVNTTIEVPSIVGFDIATNEVVRLLGERQLVLGTITRIESDLPAGIIISQDPESGQTVSPGTRVNVTVSTGVPESTPIPPPPAPIPSPSPTPSASPSPSSEPTPTPEATEEPESTPQPTPAPPVVSTPAPTEAPQATPAPTETE